MFLEKIYNFLNIIKEDRTSFVYGPIVGWICEKRPSESAAKI